MFSDLARYVYPLRKAVEYSGRDGEALKITVTGVRPTAR